MKIVIEAVRDGFGCYFGFHGDYNAQRSFAGSADDIDTAFDMAKECLAIEAADEKSSFADSVDRLPS